MSEQVISIKVVLDKLHRHPLLSDVSLETAVDYCIDFMRIVGVPRMFTDKIATITISNYAAVLPDDFIELIQVRNGWSPLRHSSDTFHLSGNRTDDALVIEDSFIVQGGCIQTTIETGKLEISYRAIATDKFGMPMIPDNSNFTRALEAYIKLQHYSILFDLGKLTQQVLFKAQQDYAWAVGSLETDMRRLDLSKAEAFFNSFRTLFIRDNEFYHGWKNDGGKQILINQK